MRCPGCSTENPDGRKFCGECGTPLTRSCTNCGAATDPGQKFCGECGTSLVAGDQPGAAPTRFTEPVAERRTCSVLFADLVGFTPLSESRDAEAVRELLSGYFDVARTVIARYGGTIEKFIGDAVMAVWGVPTAHEDDAERCVRAALELVDAVAGYGDKTRAPGLAARAGVVTGEVAVTLGAAGEGMVAGDAVNTAARVQGTAPPGTVLVDQATRAATARAVGFADAATHRLKGKAEPVRLWRASRVVATVGGSERVDGLEASFLGRDREMRAVKESFHACAQDRRAGLMSVLGVAGVGKSRLRWELFKYVDGLADVVLWHAGRCLSYGEGVAYWALAEMVRQRFGIAEDESSESAARKLDDGLHRWVTEPADRDFLTPRLGALLGTAEPGLSREELFAGWRLFFERLADQAPVLLAFEDLQWADPGLLDFIEHLLDWSAEFPIFLLTFARPELTEHRPSWGAGRSNATQLPLNPLPPQMMRALLGELVPGLPAETADRIVTQADGIPLYAVETVRSLIDRDLVQPIDGSYRLVSEVEQLDVPPSLASLVAARIDALPAEHRLLVQGLSVLGGTFPRTAVAAVSSLSNAELENALAELVRKEILTVRSDPLSPDRGQYTFSQTLVRQVAYDTLSRRERKTRHLAVAAHLRATFADDGADVTEVIAQHYQDALTAVPDDPDAEQIRIEAVAAFTRAGQRAVRIGAPETARRCYSIAAQLAGSEAEQVRLTERAAAAAFQAGQLEAALELFETSIAAHAAAGRDQEVARITGLAAGAMVRLGRNEQALPRLHAAVDVLTSGEPRAELIDVYLVLARAHIGLGDRDRAFPHVEAALELAQALELPDRLAAAVHNRARILARAHRSKEALNAYEWAAELAEGQQVSTEAYIAHNNAADTCLTWDLPGAVDHCRAAMGHAKRLGDRFGETLVVDNLALAHLFTGHWDDALRMCQDRLSNAQGLDEPSTDWLRYRLVVLHLLRGNLDEASRLLTGMSALPSSDDMEDRMAHAAATATVALGTGDHQRALAVATTALLEAQQKLSIANEAVRQAWPDALEAALALNRLDHADDLLALVADRPPGHVPPYLRAQLARYRARVAAARGHHDEVEACFKQAEALLRELGYPYWLACTQLDHAAWLVERNRAGEADPLLAEAEAAAETLAAAPTLARARELRQAVAVVA